MDSNLRRLLQSTQVACSDAHIDKLAEEDLLSFSDVRDLTDADFANLKFSLGLRNRIRKHLPPQAAVEQVMVSSAGGILGAKRKAENDGMRCFMNRSAPLTSSDPPPQLPFVLLCTSPLTTHQVVATLTHFHTNTLPQSHPLPLPHPYHTRAPQVVRGATSSHLSTSAPSVVSWWKGSSSLLHCWRALGPACDNSAANRC